MKSDRMRWLITGRVRMSKAETDFERGARLGVGDPGLVERFLEQLGGVADDAAFQLRAILFHALRVRRNVPDGAVQIGSTAPSR